MPSYPFNLATSTQKKDQGIFWSYPLNFCFKKGPERPKMPIRSREHLGTGRCEPQIGAALVTQEPSQLDRAGERGAELIRCAARVEERTVDQFDEDAPILHRLAISTNLRAALSGSVKALGSTNFMGSAANRADGQTADISPPSMSAGRAIPQNRPRCGRPGTPPMRLRSQRGLGQRWRGTTARAFARMTAGVKSRMTSPKGLVMGNARANRNRADMH